ncbi:hypothetical protein GCM10007063_22240 [Lentibacillus kapialis]|uniref:Uncharacterized protein n=1 Tax=Lentibacillus kapialis TaxID=340214 RepID=A0A917UZ49_9BACI|nr:hypothetical protein GCM10007063_22240 [Lentibacillus kapialis]
MRIQRGPATVCVSLAAETTVHDMYGKVQPVMTMSQETCLLPLCTKAYEE